MEKIGLILQERRKELGYTLDDMSVKTKLSAVQLSAIEEGNISFFKDDLSYLSYFVRYYANALGVDYNELRDPLDDTINAFTDSINVIQIQKQDEISSNIKKKANHTTRVAPAHKAKRKMDVQTFGLVAIAAAIVLLLLYTAVKVVIPSLNAKDPIEPPTVVVPKEEEKEKPETKPEDKPENKPEDKPDTKVLSVKQTALEGTSVSYEVAGWTKDQDVTVEFRFSNASWTSFTEDGTPVATPASKVFERGEKATVILKVQEGKRLDVVMGYSNGNEIFINNEKVELDASIATLPDTSNISFTFVGGKTE